MRYRTENEKIVSGYEEIKTLRTFNNHLVSYDYKLDWYLKTCVILFNEIPVKVFCSSNFASTIDGPFVYKFFNWSYTKNKQSALLDNNSVYFILEKFENITFQDVHPEKISDKDILRAISKYV